MDFGNHCINVLRKLSISSSRPVVYCLYYLGMRDLFALLWHTAPFAQLVFARPWHCEVYAISLSRNSHHGSQFENEVVDSILISWKNVLGAQLTQWKSYQKSNCIAEQKLQDVVSINHKIDLLVTDIISWTISWRSGICQRNENRQIVLRSYRTVASIYLHLQYKSLETTA